MSNVTPLPSPTVASESFGSSEYADLVGARLLDFFMDTSPWQRRLWDVGTCLLLSELIEATEWRRKRVLSEGAIAWLARDAERIAGRDPALGEREMRAQLTKTLRATLEDGTRHVRRLRELAAIATEGYLERWLELLRAGKRPSVERLARAIAAHLMDFGYSMPSLRRWIQNLIGSRATLEEMLVSAASLANRSAISFEVLVPFHSVPGAKTGLTLAEPTWRNAPAVKEWLIANGSVPTGVRQVGGFLYSLAAHDPLSAAMLATDRIERLLSRATLARGLRESPEPQGTIWVSGTARPFRLARTSRGAFVLSLVAESRLYDVKERTDLDDALELASVLNLGSPGPAIASGWAAVEALLVSAQDPEDAVVGRGAVAADRMASLVACSWPRADLTTLSYRHAPTAADSTVSRLLGMTSNQERSRVVANALASGASLTLASPSDRAAQARMQHLIDAPRSTLSDVEAHIRSGMRRLYRQRNIVMHGGSTDTLARDATLRTCAPLIGAGLDRIAHARITASEGPLQLSERARLSLDLVGSAGGPHIVDLLE